MLIDIYDPYTCEHSSPSSLEKIPHLSQPMIKQLTSCVRQYSLIQKGDRIAVGYSGGKDSLLLIYALLSLQKRNDFDFEIVIIHLDQHQPGFARDRFNEILNTHSLSCTVISKDTWSVVKDQRKKGQIPCALCSRMRRGILNQWCADHGYNKLALGHHLDDAIETFMLNMLFGRRLDPLKPATPASSLNVTTIRPLLFIEERKIESWMHTHQLQAIACPVCDSFEDAKRRDLKGVIQGFSQTQPEIYQSIREAIYGESSPLPLNFKT